MLTDVRIDHSFMTPAGAERWLRSKDYDLAAYTIRRLLRRDVDLWAQGHVVRADNGRWKLDQHAAMILYSRFMSGDNGWVPWSNSTVRATITYNTETRKYSAWWQGNDEANLSDQHRKELMYILQHGLDTALRRY